jgi:hypothetical protein
MRCGCCNRNLSDYESRLRHPVTNDFLDICKKCLKDIPIDPVEPGDIEEDTGYEDEEFINEVNDEDTDD